MTKLFFAIEYNHEEYHDAFFIGSNLFFSCFDPDKTPIAPFTHIPVSALSTKDIWRRVLYEDAFYEHKSNYQNLAAIRTGILGGHGTFNRETKWVVYENRSGPYTLSIQLENFDRKILKFEILTCTIMNQNAESKNV